MRLGLLRSSFWVASLTLSLASAAYARVSSHRVNDQVLGSSEVVEFSATLRYDDLAPIPRKGSPVSFFYRKRMETPGAWVFAASTLSDCKGKARVQVPGLQLEPGLYETRVLVSRDLSESTGLMRVFAPGQKMVVFDIDGTLTRADSELFKQIADRAYSPKMWEAADQVAQFYTARGYEVVYLTGRMDQYRAMSREWLDAKGFPAGPLLLAPTFREFMPNAKGVQAYKRSRLEHWKSVGADIRFAYGNAKTDICAYAQAGIRTQNTFIIGKHAGEACPGYSVSQAVLSYPEHLGHMPEAR